MTRGSTAARAADPAEGLALVKPAVKLQPAYTLDAPAFRRKLNQNEAPRDLPEPLKRAILDRAMAMPWHRYPEFVPHALASRMAARYGVDEGSVLVGNGSNELIQAALTVLLEPGDVVVAPAPTFSLYRLITNVIGGRYIPVALGEDFAYDEDSLVETAIAEEAKAVVVCAPNNPTGSGISDGLVRRLLERTEAMILVDEAYQEFGGPTALPLIRESSRVMVLRTFSKALGLAGLRCGVGLVHPEVAKEVAKAKLPYNVNHVTLAAAEVVLDHPQLIAEVVEETIAVRDRFTAALAQVSGFRPIPSQANFVLVRCTKLAPKVVFQRLLDEHGILVRNVSGVPELRDCLRISVGTAEDMDDALQALRAVAGA